MVILIVIIAGAAVLLGGWSASTAIESRQTVERSMQAVAQYSSTSVREQQMLETVGDRLLAPIGRSVTRVAYRFTPAGYIENVKRKIVLAGSPARFEVDRFLVMKVLGIALVPLWVLLIYVVLGLGGPIALVLVVLVAFISVAGPDQALTARIAERQRLVERALADTLDLLVISVEAGLGFDQALERTATAVPGPLSDEFRRMLQETRMGASRADALRALDERTQVDDVRTFVLAMLQADSFGISIARILKTQADEMRLRWHQRAQAKAQTAPVKMLFPLAVCIFPSLFIVLLMPAMMNIFEAL